MNPAIEKLEKLKQDAVASNEIAKGGYGQVLDEFHNEGYYEEHIQHWDNFQPKNAILFTESLKACVEALKEQTNRKRFVDGEEIYNCCRGLVAYGHTVTCKCFNALALVNRAMGVSHE